MLFGKIHPNMSFGIHEDPIMSNFSSRFLTELSADRFLPHSFQISGQHSFSQIPQLGFSYYRGQSESRRSEVPGQISVMSN